MRHRSVWLSGTSWIAKIARVCIGTVLIYAAIPKIDHTDRFLNTVMMYDLAPVGINIVMAVTIPWLELLLGVCLVLGLYAPGSLAIVAGLFTLYVIAIASALHRGLAFDCGCFGDMSGSSSTMVNTIALTRTAILGVISVGLVVHDLFNRCGIWHYRGGDAREM